MTRQHLVSRAEFARMRDVSRMAVTKWCAGWLKPACVGKRIDAAHPAAQKGPAGGWPRGAQRADYDATPTKSAAPPQVLAPTPTVRRRKAPKQAQQQAEEPPERGRGKRKKRPTQAEVSAAFDFPIARPKEWNEPDPPEDEGSDVDLEALSRRIRPIVDRFGSMHGLRDWLAALKTIEEIRTKRLDNDETEGSLIRREGVRVYLFGAIEAANVRLLRDASKTITRRLYSLAKSETPVEEAEKVVRELIGATLDPVKTKASRALRRLAEGQAVEDGDEE